ncbi:MAG: NADH-quinone oxidoreductase subunit B family protein [Candidatus Hodarchaeales archaeon]|jgi:F420-non-reducing hydrogenase small subunit
MSKARIATEWLMVCSGCEISLLDIHEAIVDVLAKADIVRSPVLADVKEFVPADVGIISGGIRNEHNIHVAKEMRKNCEIVVGLGSCACFGGVPSLGNMFTKEEILHHYYHNVMGVDNPLGREPQDDLPRMTEKVQPLSSVIKVDVAIPGCPPVPELIAQGVMSLLDGKPLELPNVSVCEPCPRVKKHTKMKEMKRWYQSSSEEIDPESCFLEQGYLCLGPATWGLCDARCTRVAVPCRGCHGPLHPQNEPGIDIASYIGTLATKIPFNQIMEALGNDPLGYFYQHQFGATKFGKMVEAIKK